jgi:hypothetical protein
MLLLGNLGKAFATGYRASGLVPWHEAAASLRAISSPIAAEGDVR